MSALSFNQYFLNGMHERWWEDEEWKWWRRREKVKKNEGCEYSPMKVHENGHQSAAENSSEAVNVCTKYTGIYKWKGAQSHHKNITPHNCSYQKGMCPGFGPCPWPVFERYTQLLPCILWRHIRAEVIIWWGNLLSVRCYECVVI